MDALTNSMKTQIRLAALADRVWAMLTHDPEPMPAMAALDYLRQESGVEDVGTLKKAIREAAVRTLGSVNSSWIQTPKEIRTSILNCGFDLISSVHYIRTWGKRRNPDPDDVAWLPWCDKAERAIAICEQIQALPE